MHRVVKQNRFAALAAILSRQMDFFSVRGALNYLLDVTVEIRYYRPRAELEDSGGHDPADKSPDKRRTSLLIIPRASSWPNCIGHSYTHRPSKYALRVYTYVYGAL